MNTIIEKIRAEVNRQREEICPTDTGEMKVVGTPTQLEQGWLNALSWMEKILDTIQEQPVKTDIVEDLKHYLATTPKEQIEKDWESLKEWGKVGPSVSEFLGWEKPVREDVEMEIKETELEYQQRSERGEYPASIESIARHFYELGRQSKPFYAEELDEEIIRYKVPFVNEKENLDERTLNAIAYHFATWMESKLLHECESAYNNGYVAGQQSKPKSCGGLEEEIDRLWNSFVDEMEGPHNIFDVYARLARHFAKWMREKMMKDGLNAVKSGESNMIEKTIAGVFVKYGMDRQKEQMMKEAVESEVWNYSSNEDLRAIPIWGINKFRDLKDGDRVKIIIIKED